MKTEQHKSLKDRLSALGITNGVFAQVYSLWDADISRYIRGLRTTKHLIDKMLAGASELEELRDTTSAPQPNWRDPQSIVECLTNLRELKKKVQHPVVPVVSLRDWFGKPKNMDRLAEVMATEIRHDPMDK